MLKRAAVYLQQQPPNVLSPQQHPTEYIQRVGRKRLKRGEKGWDPRPGGRGTCSFSGGFPAAAVLLPEPPVGAAASGSLLRRALGPAIWLMGLTATGGPLLWGGVEARPACPVRPALLSEDRVGPAGGPLRLDALAARGWSRARGASLRSAL